MDSNRPWDGRQGQAPHPAGGRAAPREQHRREADRREGQIAAQGQAVPEHQGRRRRVEQDVEQPPRLAQIHHDEQEGLAEGNHGDDLAQHQRPREGLLAVNVVGQEHRDRRGANAHKERELRNVEPPRHLARKPGHPQAIANLHPVGHAAQHNEHEEEPLQDPGNRGVARRFRHGHYTR